MSTEAMKKKVSNALQEAVNCCAIKVFHELQFGEGDAVEFYSNKDGLATISFSEQRVGECILQIGGYRLVVDDVFITCADGLNPMLTFERRGIRVATFGGKP